MLFYNDLDLNNQKILCLSSIFQFERTVHNLSHTTEDFKFIQVFEFSFIFMFWKNLFWGGESWNIILNSSTFSVGGRWGQLMSFFWKMVDETQIFLTLEATRHHNSIKLLTLLPLRADLLYILYYETPCRYNLRR